MERDHHQHLESGPGQAADFSQRGSQVSVKIGRRSKNPTIGLLDQDDTALQDVSPEALTIALEEAAFSWCETLGVPPNADTAAARVAMTQSPKDR